MVTRTKSWRADLLLEFPLYKVIEKCWRGVPPYYGTLVLTEQLGGTSIDLAPKFETNLPRSIRSEDRSSVAPLLERASGYRVEEQRKCMTWSHDDCLGMEGKMKPGRCRPLYPDPQQRSSIATRRALFAFAASSSFTVVAASGWRKEERSTGFEQTGDIVIDRAAR